MACGTCLRSPDHVSIRERGLAGSDYGLIVTDCELTGSAISVTLLLSAKMKKFSVLSF